MIKDRVVVSQKAMLLDWYIPSMAIKATKWDALVTNVPGFGLEM